MIFGTLNSGLRILPPGGRPTAVDVGLLVGDGSHGRSGRAQGNRTLKVGFPGLFAC
jgi:hypothetical protein